MKTFTILILLIGGLDFSYAQNVGIGVPIPSEKLDVNGNINLSGNIKANGIAGQNGQALLTNSSGIMVWADLSDYKNFVTFITVGSSTWTVPTGVTKIYAEIWAGGGGGSLTGGGGGGGYTAGIINVTPGGSVSYNVGGGGAAGAPNASDGSISSVSFSSTFLAALGGAGSAYTTFGYVALGGSLNIPNGSAISGQAGEAGGSTHRDRSRTQPPSPTVRASPGPLRSASGSRGCAAIGR